MAQSAIYTSGHIYAVFVNRILLLGCRFSSPKFIPRGPVDIKSFRLMASNRQQVIILADGDLVYGRVYASPVYNFL